MLDSSYGGNFDKGCISSFNVDERYFAQNLTEISDCTYTVLSGSPLISPTPHDSVSSSVSFDIVDANYMTVFDGATTIFENTGPAVK